MAVNWCPVRRDPFNGTMCPFCNVIHEERVPISLGEVIAGLCIRGAVMAFHRAMDIPVGEKPKIPTDDRVRLRLRLIAEEFFETMEAALGLGSMSYIKAILFSAIDDAPLSVDMLGFIDGLCDLDYVVEGSRIEFGVDGGPVLAEVHAANMRKVDGPLRADGKRLKPPGWVGPDLMKVLRLQGYCPP